MIDKYEELNRSSLFKVHSAYIAEIKRICGLDMHKAPNAVEKQKHEPCPCPEEKVEAIKDALCDFFVSLFTERCKKAIYGVGCRSPPS